MTADPLSRAAALPLWSGPVDPVRLGGGMTNVNFLVEDAGRRFVARIGDDIPVHQVMRFNERAASRAAAAAGISPKAVYWEPGALVIEFVEGRTLTEAAVREPTRLERILPVIIKCHRDVPRHLRGAVLMFWVFHSVRDYAATLAEGGSRHMPLLPRLMETADRLEAAVGPVDIVFGHNDLLPGNLIDDGERIWLIDWDYGGFNSPLFDLGGLSSNNGLSPAQEEWLLEAYFDRTVTDALRRRYAAMKCASLMREAMWSMVSEIHSGIDFDYAAYTAENLGRYEAAVAAYREM